MIEIGQLPNARAALALTDYLKGQGIDCKITQGEQGVTIYVVEDHHSLAAIQEFENFVAHPNDSKYLQASWDNGDSRISLDYGAPWLKLISQFITGAGPITLIIFSLCVIIYAAMQLGFANPIFQAFSFFGATADNQTAEVWRLFTPSLIHFSAMHLIFNLLWWWYLGGKIENHLGTLPLITLLLVAGTLPSLVQYFISGPNFGGLSGVVYALVGYSWVMGNKRPELGVSLPPAYMGFMLIWLVLGFTDLFGLSVANGAHVGGLVIGLLQGWLEKNRHFK